MSDAQQIEHSIQPQQESKNRKILLISPQPFFAHRGSPLRLKSTITFLTKNGYDVDILAFPFGEPLQMKGLQIERGYQIPGIKKVKVGISTAKLALDCGLALKALQLCLTRRYDAIHGVEEAAFIGAALSKIKAIPYLVDMHSDMREQFAEHKILKHPLFFAPFNFIYSRCIKGSAGVLTVCDQHTDMVSEKFKIPAFTARDLPLDFIEPFSADKILQIRNSLQIKTQKTLVYAGNLAPYQGVELLVRGFSEALLRNNDLDTTLIILGGGPEEEQERQELIKLATELGSLRQIRFVPAVPVTETRHYFSLADVLISPRLSGANTPLKIYSYLASGKPIIATDISSHTQVLNSEVAYLCQTSDDSVAEAILQAFSNDLESVKKRNEMVHSAKDLVDMDGWIKDYEKAIISLYQQIERRQ